MGRGWRWDCGVAATAILAWGCCGSELTGVARDRLAANCSSTVPWPFPTCPECETLASLPPVQLRILGHTELTCTGARTGSFVLRQPKRLALLAYLALATADGYRRRDQIVALFWPELDQAHARTQLRKVLHALRSTLGADAFSVRGEEELRLDPERVWCDAVAFRSCIESANWSEALSLYRGDLLEGLFPGGVGEEFQSWLEAQRRSLRSDAARAAWTRAGQMEMAGGREEAMLLARRAAELDPDDEEGIRRLIAMLDRHGDRAQALRIAKNWRARLRAEFDAEPAPETRKVILKVQAERKGESRETPHHVSVSPPPADAARTPSTGAVDTSSDSSAGPSRSSGPSPRPAIVGRRRSIGHFAAIAGVLLVTFLAGRSTSRADGILSLGVEDGAPSVAVLPFRDLGDSSHALMGEGLAEELTTALARMPGLQVRSSARSREAARDATDAATVGRRLRVRHVVDGSVRGDARAWRVLVRLVRVDDNVAVWAAAFDVDPGDAIGAQQRIAESASNELRARLTTSTRDSLRRR